MYKAWMKSAGLNPYQLQFDTGIPLKRAKMIYANSDDPWRGEVRLVDKACSAGGLLVSQFCATRCPEGQYLGLRWPDISLQTASLQIIFFLGQAERLIPEIADTCLKLASGAKVKTDELDRQLEDIEVSIRAARLQLRAQSPNKAVAAGLQAFIQKENATCSEQAASM